MILDHYSDVFLYSVALHGQRSSRSDVHLQIPI